MKHFVPPRAFTSRRTELVLVAADGSAWPVSMSPGIERFIGAYPRLPGLESESGLLSFRSIVAARP